MALLTIRRNLNAAAGIVELCRAARFGDGAAAHPDAGAIREHGHGAPAHASPNSYAVAPVCTR